MGKLRREGTARRAARTNLAPYAKRGKRRVPLNHGALCHLRCNLHHLFAIALSYNVCMCVCMKVCMCVHVCEETFEEPSEEPCEESLKAQLESHLKRLKNHWELHFKTT